MGDRPLGVATCGFRGRHDVVRRDMSRSPRNGRRERAPDRLILEDPLARSSNCQRLPRSCQDGHGVADLVDRLQTSVMSLARGTQKKPVFQAGIGRTRKLADVQFCNTCIVLLQVSATRGSGAICSMTPDPRVQGAGFALNPAGNARLSLFRNVRSGMRLTEHPWCRRTCLFESAGPVQFASSLSRPRPPRLRLHE